MKHARVSSSLIPQIINNVNNSSKIFSQAEISCLVYHHNYIKWFSPSLDYPCIHNPYYLFGPFAVSWKNKEGLLLPVLQVSGQKGERPDILETVKDFILKTTICII